MRAEGCGVRDLISEIVGARTQRAFSHIAAGLRALQSQNLRCMFHVCFVYISSVILPFSTLSQTLIPE